MTNVQLVADCSKDCILSKCDPSFGLHGDCWLVALPTQLWLVRSTRTTNELQTESGKLPVDKILSPSLLQILDIHIQMCVYVSSGLTDLKRWICWWKKKWWSLKICQRIRTQRHKANRQHAYIICGLFVLHIGSMLWYCSVRLYGHFLSIPHLILVVWVSFAQLPQVWLGYIWQAAKIQQYMQYMTYSNYSHIVTSWFPEDFVHTEK